MVLVYTDGTTKYTKSGCDKAIGWSSGFSSSESNLMSKLKNQVFGSDVTRSMLVFAYVENSFDYWIGVVSWKSGLSGSEGSIYQVIENSGLNITYINQYGNIASSEGCIVYARAT